MTIPEASAFARVDRRDPAARPAPGARLRAAALFVGAGIVGLWFVFQPTLTSGFRLMQSDPGDPLLHNYLLEHIRSCLARPGYTAALWSPPFFFPAADMLAYSENLLGAFPIYLVLRVGLDPFTSYQVFVMAAVVFCYASFLCLLRASSVRPGLATLGAFVFAFGSFRAIQVGHPHLLVQFFSPLALMALLFFLRRPTRGAWAGFLAATYLQLLASIHAGWFLLFGAFLFSALYLLLDGRTRSGVLAFMRARPVFIAGAGLAWMAATFFSLRPYLRVERLIGGRSWAAVELFLPRVRSWLSVPAGTLHAGWLPTYGVADPFHWEHFLFPGLVPIALAALALLRPRDPAAAGDPNVVLGRVAVGTAMVLAILATVVSLDRSSSHTLWRFVYEWVPGAKGIRAVSRIWMVTHLFLLWGGAVGAQRMLAGLGSRLRVAVVGALLVFGVVEQRVPRLPRFEKAAVQRWIQSVSKEIGPRCSVAYLPMRADQPFFVSQLVGMWAGLVANVPVVNGYSGASPPGYPDPSRSLSPEELRAWLNGQPPDGVCVLAWPAGDGR